MADKTGDTVIYKSSPYSRTKRAFFPHLVTNLIVLQDPQHNKFY